MFAFFEYGEFSNFKKYNILFLYTVYDFLHFLSTENLKKKKNPYLLENCKNNYTPYGKKCYTFENLKILRTRKKKKIINHIRKENVVLFIGFLFLSSEIN